MLITEVSNIDVWDSGIKQRMENPQIQRNLSHSTKALLNSVIEKPGLV